MNKFDVPPQMRLPGRPDPMRLSHAHAVTGASMFEFPHGARLAMFGMGCFWGVERLFWSKEGILSTMVGYSGGFTPNPTYHEVCTGRTGHTEVVRLAFDPSVVTYDELLRIFWENHNPTQGMRQGNDIGTQYRSAIYAYDDDQLSRAAASRDTFQKSLAQAGFGAITTEITSASEFYFAEDYHQQYLHKNPDGYCGIGGTGVSCPVGTQARLV